MKDANGQHVADEQHREHDARRFPRAEQEREDQHVNEAHAGEPRLANADTSGGHDCQNPLKRRKVGQGNAEC